MSESSTVPVILGLAAGVAFIFVIAFMSASYGTYLPVTPSDFLRISSKLAETQEFLNIYPDANSTMYIRDIVEYSFQEGSQEGDRYAGLRIRIDRNDGEAKFMQVNCIVIGREYDSVEMHGARLEGIASFLKNERCPQ